MQPPGEDDDRVLVEQAFRQSTFSMSIFDADQRYLRLNEEACRVMGVGEDVLRGQVFPYGVPSDVDQQGMRQALRDVAETGEPAHYESFTRAPSGVREHAWNVKLWPIRGDTGDVCAVGMAAFDSSEQHWARQRLAVLDEAAVRLGRSLDLTRTAQELVDLVVPRFADFASVDLFQTVMEGDEPASADGWADLVSLRRVAHVSLEPGTPEAAVELGGTDFHPPYSPLVRALRAGEAVLSAKGDPGLERWLQGDAARAVRLREGRTRGLGVTSVLAVPLIARGATLGVATLLRTRPDPFNQDDSALARELAGRAALCVDNARRYTRERTTALTLQRSLLPRGFVRQSAVDAACRYLPTDVRAGVGGDWFDIIPLSGARVGLVVGDVVGHGIQASATMGRLRMAVQTLADVDLPPDELLAHLDDLVLRMTTTDDGMGLGADGAGETGATCLYAVYDPVSRRLTTASAGHPPPVILEPGGTTRVLDVSAGPVLGVGGLPFEATEVELPEGSIVALFTDGLVEAADRDPDAGIARLREVLTCSDASLENRCDAVLTALLPKHPRDDVALVLARTRALHAGQVRVWDLPGDVELVAEARRLALAQLEEWGLEEAAFVTELVVSELVTNAIRYGAAPIQLRLIHDRTLICEVSDGNSTSPHLRRARMLDEGGRGLLLVAQLTNSWGTRHTATGKTIWAEQELS
ncbi:SpoIIE family protein phosphatase [Streptomyces sp. S3(2020)]|uniref:ATP-binding SpoIIE family protein phosphatase n=1 Tax=Streptomyces sp. S3(2020) TaxID=2732044 RepID=UPI001488C960|nr:SpoIIE family protein phosphatase [Streptomyces sp. S3(2020)]NNN33853.1 SpoIIE family protein phosphatase [Streptomyces sp. S3(2020)]